MPRIKAVHSEVKLNSFHAGEGSVDLQHNWNMRKRCTHSARHKQGRKWRRVMKSQMGFADTLTIKCHGGNSLRGNLQIQWEWIIKTVRANSYFWSRDLVLKWLFSEPRHEKHFYSAVAQDRDVEMTLYETLLLTCPRDLVLFRLCYSLDKKKKTAHWGFCCMCTHPCAGKAERETRRQEKICKNFTVYAHRLSLASPCYNHSFDWA